MVTSLCEEAAWFGVSFGRSAAVADCCLRRERLKTAAS